MINLSLSINEASILLYSAEIEPPGSAERLKYENDALDRLREAYRTLWNFPENRKLLARGGHLHVAAPEDLADEAFRSESASSWSMYFRCGV